MKNTIRKITALTIAVMTLCGEVACNEKNDNNNPVEDTSYFAEKNTLTEENLAEKKEIRIAVSYNSDVMREAAIRYNISHDDSRIQIVEYGKYNTSENLDGASQQLKLDIVSGKIPDIIDVSLIEGTGVENFGLYTDLYEFLDSDDELTRESFFDGVLEVSENDGKLYSIPVSCDGLYIYAGKSRFVEDYVNWSTEDIIGIMEKYPDKLLYANRDNSAELIFQTFDLREFIDFREYTCDFDNPEFISILDLCCSYPNEGVYNSVAEENMRNNKALVGLIKADSADDIPKGLNGMFGDEEYTLLKISYGFSMCLAVTESCENKVYAWDYIKELYDGESYAERMNRDDSQFEMPLTHEQFELHTEHLMNIEDSENTRFNRITSEEAELVNDIINKADSRTENLNFNIYLICHEETQRCFNGDIDSQECARTIQNRVSIYLAERS